MECSGFCQRWTQRNLTAKPPFSLAVFILLCGALTSDATVGIGDPAPTLQTGRWIQGDPVKGFETNKVYVVEFWATWCAPCARAVPHLNDLHLKFRDKNLIVIGQNIAEYGDDAEERVERFVEGMGDRMSYRIALDDRTEDKKGAMRVSWMEAASERGIPTAFVVNKEGLIVWRGYPTTLTDSVVEEVLRGEFDVAGYANSYAKSKAKNDAYYNSDDYQGRKRLYRAMDDGDWDAAEAALASLQKALADGQLRLFDTARLEILLGREDFTGACEFAESLRSKGDDDEDFLNTVAWLLSKSNPPDQRCLEIALEVAQRANRLAQGKSAHILDTLARVQFLLGDRQEAVSTQERALNAAEEYEKYAFEKTLDSYRRGELPDAH